MKAQLPSVGSPFPSVFTPSAQSDTESLWMLTDNERSPVADFSSTMMSAGMSGPNRDLGATFGPLNEGFSWNQDTMDLVPNEPLDFGSTVTDMQWDAAFDLGAPESEEQSLFGTNFDWANQDLTSLNVQLFTPPSSVRDQSGDSVCSPVQSRSDASSVATPALVPSMSPSCRADPTLYSPSSMYETTLHDEDMARFSGTQHKQGDFALFPEGGVMSSAAPMFQDLHCVSSTNTVKFEDMMRM